LELKVIQIKEEKNGKFNTEVRVSDKELECSFMVEYTQAELELENWVEKAKNHFLEIKNKSANAADIIKNFDEKGLVRHKTIKEEKEEEKLEE